MIGNAGDSYIMEVTWPRRGRVRSRSVHQFGSATSRPGSAHYADQAPLFVAQQLRPTWFHADELEDNIVCRYAPGESATTEDGTAPRVSWPVTKLLLVPITSTVPGPVAETLRSPQGWGPV